MRAVPWSTDGSDNALDIQVGMERPAEMVPRPSGAVLMENKVAERADFERWGLRKQGSEDLPSQGRLRAVGSQRGLSRVPVPEDCTIGDSKLTAKRVGRALKACW